MWRSSFICNHRGHPQNACTPSLPSPTDLSLDHHGSLSWAPRPTTQGRRIAIDKQYRGVHAAPALHAATCERHRLSRAQDLGRHDGRASDVCLAELRKLHPLLMVIYICCSYPILDSLICVYPALIVNVELIRQGKIAPLIRFDII